MFTGLTTANVLGVPFGTLLGQQLGWRSTFWAITAIGVVALVAIATLVPQEAGGWSTASRRQEAGAFREPQVWLSLLITVLGFGGMFGAFTYIAYTLTGVSGFAASTVPWLLVLFGGGLVAGNILCGRGADRSVSGTITLTLALPTLVLAGFALTAGSQALTVLSLIAMGMVGVATVPPLQTRVMRWAGEAQTLESGANIGAFNLGNAMGAWIGGLTITAGLGYTSPLWVGSAVAGLALLTALVADRGALQRAARPAA